MRDLRMFSAPWARHVAMWGAASFIASVQYGTRAANNTAAAYTVAISAVDVSRTVLIGLGQMGGSTQPRDSDGRWSLTNATTVTLTFATANNANMTFAFGAYEFTAGFWKSLQYGTVTVTDPAISNTAAISSVNTAKTLMFELGNAFSVNGVLPRQYSELRLTLTNATTITANRDSSAASGEVVTINFLALEGF